MLTTWLLEKPDTRREVTPIAAVNAKSGSNPSNHPNMSGRELAFPDSLYSTTPPGGFCWVCGTSDSTRTLSSLGGMADVVLFMWPAVADPGGDPGVQRNPPFTNDGFPDI